MKRLLSLPLLCLLYLSATAQAEFAPIGARWFQNAAIENIWDTHPLQDYYIIESEKDTLVDGLLHRKVGDYLFYQDSTKVYYRWQDSLRLIYDYGAAVGDTVRFELLYGYTQEEGLIPVQNTYIVDTVSFVQSGDVSLKKIDCRLLEGYECFGPDFPGNEAFSYSYIERIGSVRGVLESVVTCGPTIPGAVQEWLRCYQDDEVSYQTERFVLTAEEGEDCDYRMPNAAEDQAAGVEVSVFPNPTSGRLTVEGIAPSAPYELYDAGGRVIQNGRLRNSQLYIEQPGFYWLKLRMDNQWKVVKIVVF